MQRISSDIVMATADQLIAASNITKRSATGAAWCNYSEKGVGLGPDHGPDATTAALSPLRAREM